jgi:hypothetical protein
MKHLVNVESYCGLPSNLLLHTIEIERCIRGKINYIAWQHTFSSLSPCSAPIRHSWYMSQSTIPDEPKTSNRARFELELEFVQALANPFYLHSLAQQGILSQPAFINFLEYLLYWKEKDYARFILYEPPFLCPFSEPLDDSTWEDIRTRCIT